MLSLRRTNQMLFRVGCAHHVPGASGAAMEQQVQQLVACSGLLMALQGAARWGRVQADLGVIIDDGAAALLVRVHRAAAVDFASVIAVHDLPSVFVNALPHLRQPAIVVRPPGDPQHDHRQYNTRSHLGWDCFNWELTPGLHALLETKDLKGSASTHTNKSECCCTWQRPTSSM